MYSVSGLGHNCTRFFTSGRKEANGVWAWRATGRPFTYTAWLPGQPDNGGNEEDSCELRITSKDIEWNDVEPQRTSCFICELA